MQQTDVIFQEISWFQEILPCKKKNKKALFF